MLQVKFDDVTIVREIPLIGKQKFIRHVREDRLKKHKL